MVGLPAVNTLQGSGVHPAGRAWPGNLSGRPARVRRDPVPAAGSTVDGRGLGWGLPWGQWTGADPKGSWGWERVPEGAVYKRGARVPGTQQAVDQKT